ncbi:AlpA family transcriptional regulator [Porticoccus sp. W117]|uniref:helix-turn-helix transcriptional regulator n=1 Tax=Porticoccus sp. W117 TaxID=3054777 RepID=UPI002592A792|nr:AlpA family transcriptional regulator [Porticoccus sp. W117]MDM3871818.1 AlpA family transcriptional regulator [Porticoccus sp. W117]
MRLLRIKEVCSATGLPRSSVYEAIKKGAFPKPVQLTQRSVAWRSNEVQEWIESRPLASK